VKINDLLWDLHRLEEHPPKIPLLSSDSIKIVRIVHEYLIFVQKTVPELVTGDFLAAE
jgi:hypothetical protein